MVGGGRFLLWTAILSTLDVLSRSFYSLQSKEIAGFVSSLLSSQFVRVMDTSRAAADTEGGDFVIIRYYVARSCYFRCFVWVVLWPQMGANALRYSSCVSWQDASFVPFCPVILWKLLVSFEMFVLVLDKRIDNIIAIIYSDLLLARACRYLAMYIPFLLIIEATRFTGNRISCVIASPDYSSSSSVWVRSSIFRINRAKPP